MTSLREGLREISAEWHRKTDNAFSLHTLSTPEGYAAFLLAHARALFPLESWLQAQGIERLLPDWPQRSRTGALYQDLRRLGIESVAVLDMPAWSGEASDLWGVAYVLEGSRNGAGMLSGRLRAERHPWAQQALAYLEHGQAPKLWPGFVERLEAAAPGIDRDRAAAATHRTFELFQRAAESAE